MKTILYLIAAFFCKGGIFIGIIGTTEKGLCWETAIGLASVIGVIYFYDKISGTGNGNNKFKYS